MKGKRILPILLLAALMLIPGCTRQEIEVKEDNASYYQDMSRPGYQKDKSLLVGLDTHLGLHFNPFQEESLGE